MPFFFLSFGIIIEDTGKSISRMPMNAASQPAQRECGTSLGNVNFIDMLSCGSLDKFERPSLVFGCHRRLVHVYRRINKS